MTRIVELRPGDTIDVPLDTLEIELATRDKGPVELVGADGEPLPPGGWRLVGPDRSVVLVDDVARLAPLTIRLSSGTIMGFGGGHRVAVRLRTAGAEGVDIRVGPVPAAGLRAVELAHVEVTQGHATVRASGPAQTAATAIEPLRERPGLAGRAAQEGRRQLVARPGARPWATVVVAVDASASVRRLVAASQRPVLGAQPVADDSNLLADALDLIDGVAEAMGAGLLTRVALLRSDVEVVEARDHADVSDRAAAGLLTGPAVIGCGLGDTALDKLLPTATPGPTGQADRERAAARLAHSATGRTGQADRHRVFVLVTDSYPADAARLNARCRARGWALRFVLLGSAVGRPDADGTPALLLDPHVNQAEPSLAQNLQTRQRLEEAVAELVASAPEEVEPPPAPITPARPRGQRARGGR